MEERKCEVCGIWFEGLYCPSCTEEKLDDHICAMCGNPACMFSYEDVGRV